jgi:hypothetical protein
MVGGQGGEGGAAARGDSSVVARNVVRCVVAMVSLPPSLPPSLPCLPAFLPLSLTTHSLSHPLTQLLTHSLSHPLTQLLTHSLSHPLTQLLTHSLLASIHPSNPPSIHPSCLPSFLPSIPLHLPAPSIKLTLTHAPSQPRHPIQPPGHRVIARVAPSRAFPPNGDGDTHEQRGGGERALACRGQSAHHQVPPEHLECSKQ